MSEVLDLAVTGPPYAQDMDPIAVSRAALERLPKLDELSQREAKRLRKAFDDYVNSLAGYRERLDRIRDPDASFDPGNPDTIGRLVVIALLAQDRVPLAQIRPTYGSGVYAIYYVGDHPAYAEVSGTETPVYVGKADPDKPSASTPRQQGPRLFGRLVDHRGSIDEVEKWAESQGIVGRLRVTHFECRRLVCATNAQLVAERHLIGTFHPVWNQESKICFGIGKHGDAATTRRNNMSPWDVLHPGRHSAIGSPIRKGMTPHTVHADLERHFAKYPPHRDLEAIMELLLDTFRQVGKVSEEISLAAEKTDEVDEKMPDQSVDDLFSDELLDNGDTD